MHPPIDFGKEVQGMATGTQRDTTIQDLLDTQRDATIQDLLKMEDRLRRDLGDDVRGVRAEVRALEKRMDERFAEVLAELKRDRRADPEG